MFLNVVTVAAGGAIGAACRYLCGFIPLKLNSGFPLATMLINIIGSFCIGVIAALAQKSGRIDPRIVLFLKAGFCGGFTTFSTFSLENLTLLQNGSYGTAILYMLFSVILCIAGTAGGMAVIR